MDHNLELSEQHMAAIRTKYLVFTDVDGCLLNKHDYDYRPVLPVLKRLKEESFPVVLSSSKTASELQLLADELCLEMGPLICENGGQILWRRDDFSEKECEVLGVARVNILDTLADLKSEYRFRSFADLGLQGVMEATDLTEDKARQAIDRHSTEPLLWDDDESRINSFAEELKKACLTFTKGGRFWHVAGDVSKGDAMKVVADRWNAVSGIHHKTIAIGDSPIDQSMLDVADISVAIPAPDGTVNVCVDGDASVIAATPGAVGWAESITCLLDRMSEAR